MYVWYQVCVQPIRETGRDGTGLLLGEYKYLHEALRKTRDVASGIGYTAYYGDSLGINVVLTDGTVERMDYACVMVFNGTEWK